MNTYAPRPIDTRSIELSVEIKILIERLAEHAHDLWAIQRISEGWSYGLRRDDASKKHPVLVHYRDLPETEKEYDRAAAGETIKAILALGWRIDRVGS